MSRFFWRLREFVRKALIYSMMAAVAYGGYTLYRRGTFNSFKRGIGPGIHALTKQIPYFGSRFRRYLPFGQKEIAKSHRHSSKKKYRHSKHSRKHRKSKRR